MSTVEEPNATPRDDRAGRIDPPPGWTKFVRLAPEGMVLLVPVALTTLISGFISPWFLAPLGLALLFSLWFFRDPKRRPPQDPDVVLSAADGRVAKVERIDEGLKISVFMSVFNVHVNRSPVAGVVRGAQYFPGEFINAMRDIADEVNERLTLTIDTPRGVVLVTQVAGLIARRIVCHAVPGYVLDAGERYGVIRFGSCVVVVLPDGFEPLVAPGARVKGGLSPIARWTGDAAEAR